MLNEKLQVVVIRTPYSKRYLQIDALLGSDSRFELKYIEASMARTYQDIIDLKIAYSTEIFEFLNGRKFTPAEIGCADSHNRAREIIKQHSLGGIILEDDARIVNIDNFYKIVLDFLQSKNDYSILNLTPYSNLSKRYTDKVKILRIYSAPDLAVSYALTPKAAGLLLDANQPINTVADWPLTKCNFYIPNLQVVVHGDPDTNSFIANDQDNFREKYSTIFKIIQFLCIPYFTRKIPIKFKDYINFVYLRRIVWNSEKIRLKVLGYKKAS